MTDTTPIYSVEERDGDHVLLKDGGPIVRLALLTLLNKQDQEVPALDKPEFDRLCRRIVALLNWTVKQRDADHAVERHA